MPATEQTAGPPRGPLYDLLRLQTDFQEKLAATTLAYLRELQGLVGPVVPGTVVDARTAEPLSAAAEPGGQATLELEVENRQRAFCLLTPMLSPLAGKGVTWLPRTQAQPRLVAPDAVERVAVTIEVAAETPPGVYRGALILYGLREGAVPVQVEVRRPPAPAARTRARRPARGRPRRRSP